jgi:shikimate kinase
MNLILFGFKGCGKTYFGRRAAVDYPFLDTDELLSKKYGGRSPRELFLEWGEAKFRLEERQIVKEIAGVTKSIISLGGGTVLNPNNVILLQTMGTLIYLKASFELIQLRGTNPIRAVYEARLPIYEAIPAKILDLDCLSDVTIIAKIQELLHV